MRHRPLAVAGLCSSALLSGLVVAGPATASSPGAVSIDQSYWVPVDKQLVVRGHGFGHGHGMSQYGAEGAARQGLDYSQILAFYYPGTTPAQVHGRVRVLITEDTTSDLVVAPTDGLTLRDRGDGQTYRLPDIPGLRRWRLRVAPDHHTVVRYKTRHWHAWATPDGKKELVGDGEFSADGPLTLFTPSGRHDYRGVLRSASPRRGSAKRDTVNVLSMDEYVKGVVPAEMPASWEPAAVRAQAVAARTYGAWSRAQHPHRYYQICDTSSCQVYRGVDGEDPRSNDAVDATSGEILTYDGKAAFAQFSSSDGGWTSAGSVPYLPAKADPYDDYAGNPVHDWSRTVDANRLEDAYPSIGRLRRIEVVERDGNGDWEGRVEHAVLDGTRADATVTGDTLRWVLGLRSDWFTIDPTPIMARWHKIGGDTSKLGRVTSREYGVRHGSSQKFAHGRIYYSRRTGAHELYGAVLDAYRAAGGPKSRLRLPVTRVQKRRPGVRAKFQGGVVYASPATGAQVLIGKVGRRYRQLHGVFGYLGWPTRGNYETATGERADFQHGSMTWSARTGHVTVHPRPH